jgi:hypothetical protein
MRINQALIDGRRHLTRVQARVLLVVMLSALAAGCGTTVDDAGAAFTSPGKFEFYRCEQLESRLTSLQKRERELGALMAKAEQGPLGAAIGTAAYRTEYLQVRNDQKAIGEVRATKNCSSQSNWQSNRALW